MAKLSLAEAVKLKSVLSKRIHELEDEMDRAAFIEMEKGSKLPKQARTLQNVEEDIEEVRKDFRLLDKLMYQANIENKIMFDHDSIPIVEAIELAAQLRAKARKCKEYGAAPKEEYVHSFSETVSIIRKATFEPETYRVKAIELDRHANKLSNLINAINYTIELEFNSEKYF